MLNAELSEMGYLPLIYCEDYYLSKATKCTHWHEKACSCTIIAMNKYGRPSQALALSLFRASQVRI